MPSSLRDLLIVLGRWPRRLATLACLLLAGASALAARAEPPAPAASAPPARADLLGVPVHVRGSPGYLHAGDHVDLLAAPPQSEFGATSAPTRTPDATGAAVVAADVAVVRVSASAIGGDGCDIVVGVDRSTALRLAALGTRDVVAAVVVTPRSGP